MNISIIIGALRKGASVPNPTPFKWAGVAATVALIALSAARLYGVGLEISDEAMVDLVMLVLIIYSKIATTDKIGLPAARDDSDTVHEWVPRQPVPPDAPKADERNADGFPRGPFFDQ